VRSLKIASKERPESFLSSCSYLGVFVRKRGIISRRVMLSITQVLSLSLTMFPKYQSCARTYGPMDSLVLDYLYDIALTHFEFEQNKEPSPTIVRDQILYGTSCEYLQITCSIADR